MSDEAINTSANTVLFMEIIKSGQTTINEYSSLHFGYIQLKNAVQDSDVLDGVCYCC